MQSTEHFSTHSHYRSAKGSRRQSGLPIGKANPARMPACLLPRNSISLRVPDFSPGRRFNPELALAISLVKRRAGHCFFWRCPALMFVTALNRASLGMMSRLGVTQDGSGIYCCGKCTAALWRHLAVGGLEDSERRLTTGSRALKSHRDGNGKWRTFPFYYTLLVLSEIDLPLAVEEMRYASTVCQRYLRRSSKDDRIAQRRRILAERVLRKC